MKTIAPILVLMLGLSACKADRDSTIESSSTASSRPASAQTAAEKEQLLVPGGFKLNFPYQIISKETVNADSRKARVRYHLEFLDRDARAVVVSLRGSAKAAGFEKISSRRFADGRYHFVARRSGIGQLQAEVTPAEGLMLNNPKAKGTVKISWPSPRGKRAATQVPTAATDKTPES